MADDETVSCDYCGTSAWPMSPTAEAASDSWLTTHVERINDKPYPDTVWDNEWLEFCSADHAGRYFLEGRLRAPDFRNPQPYRRTWRERLFDWAMLALFLYTVLLCAVGAWTIVQWISH